MNLNRRAFLPSSLVGVALAGSQLSAVTRCTTTCSPNPCAGWTENATSKYLRATLTNEITPVKEKKSVRAISAATWSLGASHTTALGNLYGQLGNCHRMDQYVLAHETALKAKYGIGPVNVILEYGSHWLIAQVATQFGSVGVQLAALDEPAVLLPKRPICTDLAFWTVSMDFLALALALDPVTEPAAAGLGVLGLVLGVVSLFACE